MAATGSELGGGYEKRSGRDGGVGMEGGEERKLGHGFY